MIWEQMHDHPSDSLRALWEGITAPSFALTGGTGWNVSSCT